ncbi:MAG: hypothetical protein FJZ96_00630 [Chloroflexi bacterium]|nr:hypothetical protein [Chloroflexota bacterium]
MKTHFPCLVLALLLAACGNVPPSLPTGTPSVTAGTAPPTKSPSPEASPSPTPSNTPLPPSQTPPPTFTPVDGFTNYQVNVRTGPGTNYDTIGLINHSQVVQLTGRDAGGEWYQILYPEGLNGRAWIVSTYVQTADADSLPVIGLETSSGEAANTARVLQRLNVRAGPGLDYAILGMIEPPATVILTGKNQIGSWLQVAYDPSPTGLGWVAVAYIQVTEMSVLPALDESGTPIPVETGGATAVPLSPTPTLGPALADGDSLEEPGLQVVFSPLAARAFTYNNAVSAPDGDLYDWVAFTPFASQAGKAARLSLSLSCGGSGELQVHLLQNGTDVEGWGSLECGDRDEPLLLAAGAAYQFRLEAAPGAGLRLTPYTLTVRNLP